tara:strand:- start:473 stop:661 length:189 start_codon:yes stop_codon:yes gene_type:complete
MMNTTKPRGRPAGVKNAKPTKQAINGYYRLLRNAADGGDVLAAAELIRLSCSEQSEINRNGI